MYRLNANDAVLTTVGLKVQLSLSPESPALYFLPPRARQGSADLIGGVPNPALVNQQARPLCPDDRSAEPVCRGQVMVSLAGPLRLVEPGVIVQRHRRVIRKEAGNFGRVTFVVDVADLFRHRAQPVRGDDIAHKRIGDPFPAHLAQCCRIEDLALQHVAPEGVLADDRARQQLAEIAVEEFGDRYRGRIVLVQVRSCWYCSKAPNRKVRLLPL